MVAVGSGKSKSRLLELARKNCANWDNGRCIGCMMKTDDKVIIFRISGRFANKPCQVNKKCEYFDNVVIQGINNGT